MLRLCQVGKAANARAFQRLAKAAQARRFFSTPANPKPDSSKAPVPKKDSQSPQNVNKNDDKSIGPLRATRKPTVAEEISYTKRIDLKRLAAGLLAVLVAKAAYDFYCNTLQIASYDDPKIVETMWSQVGEDIWLEGATTRVVVRRFGKDLGLSGQPSVVKRRQIRYWNTFEYITEALMFMLRFRVRIWEDIGTVEIAVPIQGSKKEGTFHLRAYTRDRLWIVDKAWIEDEEMIIELKRRIQLDFLLNPEPDLLIEFEKNRK